MKILCRIFGHKRYRVTVVDAYDGRRYYSHPNGTRIACHRCQRVLPKSDLRLAAMTEARVS